MQLINDLSVKLKRYEDEINASISRVINSGWLVLGPEVEQFESSFADYHASKYCVGVANGTDALELGLRAVGVKSGDLVATVANAGGYTTTALNSIGASAYFLEVDRYSQCATLASVESALEVGVSALVVTHLFGRVVPEILQIAELCRQYGVPLLEDCAQAHGACLGSTRVGAFGDIASFSFYPTKNLGALGDGGAIVTDKQEYAQAVTQLRQYGWQGKYKMGVEGGRNSRLDAIQAALLSEFLLHLDGWNDERLRIALRYDAELSNELILKPPMNLPHETRSYVAHLYVVQTMHRDQLQEHLKQHRILSDVHYPIPDHKQKVMSDSNAVSLPIGQSLEGQMEVVFVVDGSPDQSFAAIKRMMASSSFPAQLVGHSRNFGSFAAIRTGLSVAHGKYFGVIAADLQEPISLLEDFFHSLQAQECDIALGTRKSRKDAKLDSLFSNLFWWAYRKFVIPDMPRGGVDVFGCNRAFRDELLKLEEAHSSLISLIFWLGFRRKEIPYDRLERQEGTSSWTFAKKFEYMTDSIFAFTNLPVKLLIRAGVLGLIGCLGLSTFVLIGRLSGAIDVSGYSTTLIVILTLGSANLLGLGVVGSYAWRAFENSKARPLSVTSTCLKNKHYD